MVTKYQIYDLIVGLFCFGILSFFSFINANAGTLTTLNANPEREGFRELECNHIYSGVIERGDAKKFKKFGNTYDGEILCLNSPGGDILEGLKLFEVIWENNLMTYIRSGDTCASSCALAFLGGSVVTGTGLVHQDRRAISPSAKLGFHAPMLRVDPDIQYSGKQVESAFRVALKAAEGLFKIKLKQFYDVEPMPDFLYKLILETPSSEMNHVDTVGKAVLAGIRVINTGFPSRITKKNIENICDLTYLENNSFLSSDFLYQGDVFEALKSSMNGGVRSEIRKIDDRYVGLVRSYPSAAKFQEKICIVRFEGPEITTGNDDRPVRELLTSDRGRARVNIAFVEGQALNSISDIYTEYVRPHLNNLSGETKIPAYYLFDPKTKLEDISKSKLNPTMSIAVSSQTTRQNHYRCFVFSGDKVIDDEICEGEIVSPRRNKFISKFTWPSGAKTVIELFQGHYKINGTKTTGKRISRKHGVAQTNKRDKIFSSYPKGGYDDHCWHNPKSGNDFCVIETF